MKSSRARDANTAMLRLVVERMGRVQERVVFLGGTVIPFLLTRPVPLDVRISKDVDFTVEFDSKQELYEFEDQLWEHGFKKRGTGAICRWTIERVNVDVLPAEPVLGFSSWWCCAEALHYAQQVDLGNDTVVNMIPAPSFIGIKLSAFRGRGRDNYTNSYDVYDLLLVIAGRPEIERDILEQTSPKLRGYLCSELQRLLNRSGDLGELGSRYCQSNQEFKQLLPEVISRIKRIMAISCGNSKRS
jgi:predicted nucleotidyltransferase